MAGRNKLRQCRVKNANSSSINQSQTTISKGILEPRQQICHKEKEVFNNSKSLAIQKPTLDHQRTVNYSERTVESKSFTDYPHNNQRELLDSSSKKTDQSHHDEMWDYYPKQVQKVLKKKRASKESKLMIKTDDLIIQLNSS